MMKLFLLFALLGLAAGYDYPRYYSRYYANYTERYYTERRREPTAEPPAFIQRAFGIRERDINETIEEHKLPVHGRHYYWNDDITDFVTERIIPEVCHLTSKNWTIYNSYLLDRNCLKQLENVSPKCRSFRCDAVHYFLKHGADIYANFIGADSIKEAVEVVQRELTAIFDDMSVCTCGKEFFGAVFKCAPFYDANIVPECNIQRYARSLDIKSLSKIFNLLLDGICVKTSAGRCLNSIITAFEEVAEMIQNTIEDYEEYDDGDKKSRKQQEKRCDALFSALSAFHEYGGYDSWEYSWETDLEMNFNQTAAFMNSFYCDRNCKKQRSSVYPCCMRMMIEDKKLHSMLKKFLVSIYRVWPIQELEFDGYGQIGEWFFYHGHSVEEIMAWKIPPGLWNAGMRTLNAAKYCQGKMVKCSDNPRSEA